MSKKKKIEQTIYEIIYDPELGGFYCFESFETIAAPGKCLHFVVSDKTKVQHDPMTGYELVVQFLDGVYRIEPHGTSQGSGSTGPIELFAFPTPGSVGCTRLGQRMIKDDDREMVIVDNIHLEAGKVLDSYEAP